MKNSSFRSLKRLLRLVVPFVLLAILVYQDAIQIELGPQGERSSSEAQFAEDRDPSEVILVTGTLLISPNDDAWEYREDTMVRNDGLQGWLYHLTYKHAKELFRLVAERGTTQIILENQKYKQYANDFKKLEDEYLDSTVELRGDRQMKVNYTHAKTFFGSQGFVIQTANLTYSSFFKNKEHFFFGSHPAILENLKLLFAKDRAGEKLTQEDIHPNLLICPINCRTIIEYYLSHAKSSIWMQEQYITDPSLQKILNKKVYADKLDVRIAVPDKLDNQKLRQLLGVDVVHLVENPYIHSKTILIDGKILLLGSMNGSSNSLDNNREIGIVILDEEVTGVWKQDFEHLWEN